MPLYLHVVSRILRDMRITQQQTDSAFDYKAFKQAIDRESLTDGQLVPLQQRLETLESFMVRSQTLMDNSSSKSKDKSKKKVDNIVEGESWSLHVSVLSVCEACADNDFIGRTPHHRRSLMPMRYCRGSMLPVQHLSQFVSRTKGYYWPCSGPG
jgi:hypothetical protein